MKGNRLHRGREGERRGGRRRKRERERERGRLLIFFNPAGI